MVMNELFDLISFQSSRLTTMSYSTSFSMGIRLFSKRYRYPIYVIYGFVRFAGEIVDSLQESDARNYSNGSGKIRGWLSWKESG